MNHKKNIFKIKKLKNLKNRSKILSFFHIFFYFIVEMKFKN